MRVGVLGGTFDPIHLGHLMIAEEARRQLDLRQVLFIPAGQPRLRADEVFTSTEDRLRMVQLAVADNPYFEACDTEIGRSGPTYTVETLEGLLHDLGRDTCIFFIVGLDALKQFHLWKDPERVLELCRVVAVCRPGHDDFDWASWSDRFHQIEGKITRLSTTQVDISGTEIRQRAGRGESLRHLVSESVAEYIRENRLYLPR